MKIQTIVKGESAATFTFKKGVLAKGLYIAKGYKYVFKDGVLLKGAYTHETENGVDALFEDGVLSHLIEMKI